MKKTKTWFWIVLTILLALFAIASVCYASIMQMLLCYEKYGVVFNKGVFIPHNSAWWFLGGLGFIPIRFLVELW